MSLRLSALTLLLLLAVPRSSAGQAIFESAGERALGMAGAFVAVANDATATHWNPAGLATAGPLGMTIGLARLQIGNQSDPPAPGAWRRQSTLTSLGSWPLGVSYGRFHDTRLTTSGTGELRAETLRTSQVAVTLLQTLLPGLVVGSTVKLLRGEAVSEPIEGETIDAALDAGSRLRGDRRTTIDLDIGVMASSDVLRIGLTTKNLRSPRFGDSTGAQGTLPRQTRVGVALLPTDGLTLAMDLDLNTVDLGDGRRRMGAVGGEAQLGSHLALRTGVRWSLVGPRQPVTALGVSLGVGGGLWLDGHYATGRSDDTREFGAALRAGF
jgi:hypothetical protein